MSVAEPQLKALTEEVSEIEARILDKQIAAHHVLTILRLTPDEALTHALAQYAYSIETRCLGYRDVAHVAVTRLAEAERANAAQAQRIAELRELLRLETRDRRAA